jgi:SHS2 domain-containing protein
MPFELIDHQADVGLRATGTTLEEALADGVRGLLSIMVNLDTIEGTTHVNTTAEGDDPGSLYVSLLNAAIAAVDIHGMFFRDIIVSELTQDAGSWTVHAELIGETIDLKRHEVDSDVKAATYGGLLAEEIEHGWRLRCVLDL